MSEELCTVLIILCKVLIFCGVGLIVPANSDNLKNIKNLQKDVQKAKKYSEDKFREGQTKRILDLVQGAELFIKPKDVVVYWNDLAEAIVFQRSSEELDCVFIEKNSNKLPISRVMQAVQDINEAHKVNKKGKKK